MPPPGGIGGIVGFGSGFSVNIASMVTSRPRNRCGILQRVPHDLGGIEDFRP